MSTPRAQGSTWWIGGLAAALILLAVILSVPLATCPICEGNLAGMTPSSGDAIFCGCCQGDRRVTLYRKWSYEIEKRRLRR